MRESVVDKIIKKDLASYGEECYFKKAQGNVYQQAGTPDYYGSMKGKYFAIEAKAGNGHPLGMAQLFNGYKIVRSGGVFVVAFPDYTTFVDIPRHHFGLELHGDKANQLSDEEYDQLEKIYHQVNAEKKSIMFY